MRLSVLVADQFDGGAEQRLDLVSGGGDGVRLLLLVRPPESRLEPLDGGVIQAPADSVTADKQTVPRRQLLGRLELCRTQTDSQLLGRLELCRTQTDSQLLGRLGLCRTETDSSWADWNSAERRQSVSS